MDAATLARARAGADEAFRQLTAPHLAELHRHCYRMLGSLTDADDALQEVLVAAWQGLNGFEGRSSLRTWLYRIATNRCLNQIRSRQRRGRPMPVPPFEPPEPTRLGTVTWLQPYPDSELEGLVDRGPGPAARYGAREAVELAFMTALQTLPPRQIAALLLCDVLSFSTAESAAMLDTTNTALKGLLQRARASLDQRLATNTSDKLDRGSVEDQHLARRFADAFTQDDVGAVIALLTDDAWLVMPPAPHEYRGHEAIAAFLRASQGWRTGLPLLMVPTRANTQPAFGCYLADGAGSAMTSLGMVVLTTSGDRIRGITRFLDEELPARFGLAAALG
ncbi:RNA polymerase subunit sigma-70 [Blastococcus sp. CT_GayMR16]|uniref:RNA polymerase subunit sigma-70 n=1 Tax=Blastococcus sp. CT_GayMR16 TaxID=2559607 RepID=UPI001073EBC1|nr:RNA polymerase subunit sigma-70 [Blastococcus sp. CT_GayMR16]TFV87038.1 sigma-70 family RNA polymerase sigma factor [Blastococcus sp. CT_GayMR16]